MAINKKGSRNISVAGHRFRWRATGSDGNISVVIWPEENDDSRVVTSVGYHNDWQEVEGSHLFSDGQLIVTNRMIRAVIEFVGVDVIVKNTGQLNIEPIEKIYDVSQSVRSK